MRKLSQINELHNLTMSVSDKNKLTQVSPNNKDNKDRKQSYFDFNSVVGGNISRSLTFSRPSISLDTLTDLDKNIDSMEK